VAVPVDTGATFRAGAPNVLFHMPLTNLAGSRTVFGLSPDGQRILVNQLVEGTNRKCHGLRIHPMNRLPSARPVKLPRASGNDSVRRYGLGFRSPLRGSTQSSDCAVAEFTFSKSR
jgi:hypothetical protein